MPNGVGLYGFGAAAHIIICQLVRWQGRRVFAFTPCVEARGNAGIRAVARRRMGRRLAPAAAGAARRGDHLRTAGELVPVALAATAATLAVPRLREGVDR